jgi:DNA replication protein DnaC
MNDVSPDLRRALKSLRLGKLLPILPERLRVTRERKLDPEDVLLTLFTDEIERRNQQHHARRAKTAGLLASLVFDELDRSANVALDTALLDELRTLRFIDSHFHALIVGPVGVGKTMLAHALGHLAIVRDLGVVCLTADKLLHRLRASRLDGTYERELRRFCDVDLLIIDDLGLRMMDATDLYEIVCARHRKRSMIISSNREPAEWLTVLADPLHGQALVDRFTNNAYDLVVEGESYRKRQKPSHSV